MAKSAPAPVDPKTFKLGAEDVIFVQVWREPDLTRPLVIRPDGKVTMPLMGEVQAAGLTPMELANKITDGLSQFMKKPEVFVSVQAVRSKKYYISGEVYRSGAFPLAVPTTVMEALTQAGGFRDFAKKSKIVILRGNERLKFNYDDIVKGKNVEKNVLLEDGDHIIVP